MPILGVIASSIAKGGFEPTGSYDALATYTVGSGGVSSIEFAGLPTGGQYTHLQIRGTIQSNRATYPFEEINVTFNNDTGSNYSYHNLDGDGGSAYAQGNGNQAFIRIDEGGSSTAGTWGGLVLDIYDYASISKYKTTKALAGATASSSYAGYYGIVGFNSGSWRSFSPISTIKIAPAFSSQFNQYTQISVYGIRG